MSGEAASLGTLTATADQLQAELDGLRQLVDYYAIAFALLVGVVLALGWKVAWLAR